MNVIFSHMKFVVTTEEIRSFSKVVYVSKPVSVSEMRYVPVYILHTAVRCMFNIFQVKSCRFQVRKT